MFTPINPFYNAVNFSFCSAPWCLLRAKRGLACWTGGSAKGLKEEAQVQFSRRIACAETVEGRPKAELPTIVIRVMLTLIFMYWPGLSPLVHVALQDTVVMPEALGHPQDCAAVAVMPESPVALVAAFWIPLAFQPFCAA